MIPGDHWRVKPMMKLYDIIFKQSAGWTNPNSAGSQDHHGDRR